MKFPGLGIGFTSFLFFFFPIWSIGHKHWDERASCNDESTAAAIDEHESEHDQYESNESTPTASATDGSDEPELWLVGSSVTVS